MDNKEILYIAHPVGEDVDLSGLSRLELNRLCHKIAYGYLIRNYSRSFVGRCKDRIKVLFVDTKKAVIEIHCASTGNEFRLNIDFKKCSIEHLGCYAKNRGFDSKSLINYSLKLVLAKR